MGLSSELDVEEEDELSSSALSLPDSIMNATAFSTPESGRRGGPGSDDLNLSMDDAMPTDGLTSAKTFLLGAVSKAQQSVSYFSTLAQSY